MTERSLRVLEFTKIRDRLCELAVSDMGRELAGALAPSANLSEIRYAQEETEEAHVLLSYLGEQPIVPFPDIRQALKLAQIGGMLSPRSLLDVAACMRAARAGSQANASMACATACGVGSTTRPFAPSSTNSSGPPASG